MLDEQKEALLRAPLYTLLYIRIFFTFPSPITYSKAKGSDFFGERANNSTEKDIYDKQNGIIFAYSMKN